MKKSCHSKREYDNKELFLRGMKKSYPLLKKYSSEELTIEAIFLKCQECEKETARAYEIRWLGKLILTAEEKDVCPECENKALFRILNEESENQRRQMIRERLCKDYLFIPKDLENAGFKNFIEHDATVIRAKEIILEYLNNFMNQKLKKFNLILIGNPGAGKSHLATAVARTLKERGYAVGYFTMGRLLTMFKESYDPSASKNESMIFKDLEMFDLVVIDDLGAEAIRGSREWRISMMLEVLERLSNIPKVYTTNITEDELSLVLEGRIASRVIYKAEIVDMFTADYRRKDLNI